MITAFNTSKHHIFIEFSITHPSTGTQHTFNGIIDTGAPRTEFADIVLRQAGFIDAVKKEVKIKQGLQTQKYGKIIMPAMTICGHNLENFEVLISRFDNSWGIAALIGLDFFRRIRVTVDYEKGALLTQPYMRCTNI